MTNNILYKDDKYEIKFDEKNGYYHLFPIPTKKELDDYYAKEFYSENYSKQINDSSEEVQKEEVDFFNMQHEDIIEIIEKEAPGKKIIDIGCGYGYFLNFCHDKGYDTIGCDPVLDAVESAKKRGVKAFQADIEDFSLTLEEKYDVAVMLNVLEHLRHPHEILQDIHKNVLKDDGVLVIKSPNEFNKFQVIANKEYDLNQWWVSIPQHINYFTIEHLEKLVTNCGFEVILKESTFPLEMFLLFGEGYVGHPEIGKKIHNKRVLFEKTLKKYDSNYRRKFLQAMAELGVGRDFIIYAKKIKK